jgi:hypothetical protein
VLPLLAIDDAIIEQPPALAIRPTTVTTAVSHEIGLQEVKQAEKPEKLSQPELPDKTGLTALLPVAQAPEQKTTTETTTVTSDVRHIQQAACHLHDQMATMGIVAYPGVGRGLMIQPILPPYVSKADPVSSLRSHLTELYLTHRINPKLYLQFTSQIWRLEQRREINTQQKEHLASGEVKKTTLNELIHRYFSAIINNDRWNNEG